MRNRVWFLLLVGIVINVHAGRKRNFGAGGKRKCHNRQFQRHTMDKYSYSAVLQNGLLGTTDNVTQMELKATVFVTNDDGCEFYLNLTDVTLSEKIGKKPTVALTSEDFVKRLTTYGLRFTMKMGMVTSIKPSVESTEADVLNIQRGILSMLQVRMLGNRNMPAFRMDTDVSGTCETKYSGNVIGGQSYIEKSKDLNSCKDHTISHTNIDGIPMSNTASGEKDPLLKSTSVCSYRIQKSKKGGLKLVVCKEHFLVRPFSSELGAGAFVSTRTSLSKTDSNKIKGWKFPYDSLYESSIKYDSSAEHKNAHEPSNVYKAIQMINEMAKDHYRESKFKSAEKFVELVVLFRHLKPDDIGDVMKSVGLTEESVRSHLFDALAQCGTSNCLRVLFETLQKNKMLGQLPRLMPYLAFTKEPTPEVIRLLMGMKQQQQNPSLVLLISTLVYKMCQHRPDECGKKGTTSASRVVSDMDSEMVRLLGKDCTTKDKAEQNNIFYALKGIGNLGRPYKAFPLIYDCIKNAEHAYISVAAIQALRRMMLTQEDRNKLYDVLTNKNEHLEKRVELFMMLMKDPTDVDIILARDLSNDEVESGQLRSLINSYLRSAVNNTDPTRTSTTMKFKTVLEKYNLNTFDPSASRYSKAFIHSTNLYQFGNTANGMSLFHPESFVPRTVNLNLTSHMFGYSINPLEINARMEGMETVLQKYFGKNGYFGAGYMKKLFEIPSLGNKERKRRSTDRNAEYDDIDAQVNMKWLAPQAMISLKVFGNEIQILSLDDLPFLKGELGNRNIIRDLYELTKGKRTTYKQNLILLEVSHAVPTIVGLPLKVAVNVSATVTVDLKGKVLTTNILFGPKAATIEGSMKPSISIHASGKVSTSCLGVGNIGTTFQANMHAANELSGKVEYEEGKDLLFDLNADNEIKDVMNISYKIFHETTTQKEAISGVSKRAKGYFCTGDYIDAAAVFGTNTCIETSFPISYYNLTVPYAPLTGPFNFGIRSYPVDPLLKKYRLAVNKNADLYTILISTPESSYERDYEIKLGAAMEGSWTVGFLYGKDRKGIVLSTQYEKKTNEMKASFISNITQLPINSEVRFFNETDPETFGRKLGGAVKLMVGKYYSDHSIYYEDTYDYLALGGRFEYMRDKVASLELKVQYEPQMFSLQFDHPPTNCKVFAYGIPNVFQLEGGLNVTHGKDFRMSSKGKLDITKLRMDGYVDIQPMKYVTKMNARLNPKTKTFIMNVDANGQPFVWVGSLKKLGYNLFKNVFNISNKIVKMESKWSSKLSGGFIMWDNFQAGYNANINIKKDGYEEIGNVNYNGSFTTYHYKSENTQNMTETCVTGSVMSKNKFGNCVERYTSAVKKGYIVKVLSGEGTWVQPFLFLMKTPQDGSVEVEIKIMQYVNMKYKRDVTKKLSFNFGVMDVFSTLNIKEESGKGYKDLAIRYADIFNMFITFKEEEDGKDVYNLKFTKDDIKVDLRAILRTLGENFQYTFGYDIRGPDPYFKDSLFNVILKDKMYNGGDDKLYRTGGEFDSADVIMDFDTKRSYMSAFEYRPVIGNPLEGMQPFKVITDITDKIYQTTLKIKSAGPEYEEKLMYSFDTSDMSMKIKVPVGGYVRMLLKNINRRSAEYKMGVSQVAQIIGLDAETVKQISFILSDVSEEYFMTFECNGEDIKNKYFTKENIDMLYSVFLKTLFYPFTPQLTSLLVQMDPYYKADLKLLAQYLRNASNFLEQSILSHVTTSVKGAITKYVAPQYQPLLPINELLVNFGKTFENRDVFATKFVSYVQTLINAMQKSYIQKLEGIDVKKDFGVVLKYLPGNIKGKFIKILKKTVTALQTWKYNTTLTPLQNIKYLMRKLNQANVYQLFIFNHENIMVKVLFQQVKFPGKIKTAVLEFTKNSNYMQLFIRLTRFVLTKYKVQGNVEDHIKNLMDSQTFSEYSEKFSKLEFDDGVNIPDDLFSQLKTILKEQYRIPVAVLDIVDELFSKVDIKTFSLKDLPVLLVSNKIPNVIKKFIIFLQKTDLTEYLVRIMKVVLPELANNVERFITIWDETENFDAFLLKTYKHVIDSLKEFIDTDQLDMMSIEKLTRVMEMILSDKDTALQLKNMVLDSYDRLIDQLGTSNEIVMDELGTFPSKVRKHLSNIDVDLLKQNTSLAMLNLFDELFKEFTSHFDAWFRPRLQDAVAQLPKLIMSKLTNNETLLKDYEMSWERLNLFAEMATKFFDDMIKSGNGTFSIVEITKNIMEQLKSYDHEVITMLLDNLDITKYANLTYDTFMDGIKQFVNDIGSIKSGNKTLNEKVLACIQNLKQVMSEKHDSVQYVILKMKEGPERNKNMTRNFFNMLRGYIRMADKKENKLIKFAVEALVPGIDGLFLLDKQQGVPVDECLRSFLGSYGIYNNTVPAHLENKLTEYRKSFACDIANLKNDIRDMKKDLTFPDKLLDKLEEMALKMFDENINSTDHYGEMLKSIMVGNALFGVYDVNAELGEIIFDVGERVLGLLNKIDMVEKMITMVGEASVKISYKKLIQKYVIRYLRSLPLLLSGPIKVIDQFGNKYIFPSYLKMKAKFHNVTMLLNAGKDFILDRISRFTNPDNSDGYLKLLPEALAERVKQTFNEYQNKVISLIHMTEREIRKGRMQLGGMFDKYRSDINKQFELVNTSIKKYMSKYLTFLLLTMDKYTARLNTLFKPVDDAEWNDANLMEKFTILSKRTKQMRIKYTNIKRQSINNLRKKVWKKLLKVEWLQKKNKDAVVYFLEDLDFDKLNLAMTILKKDSKQVLIDAIAMAKGPLVTFLQLFDAKVCDVKQMVGKLFPNKDDFMHLNYDMKFELTQEAMRKFFFRNNDVKLLKEVISYANIGYYPYDDIKGALQETLEFGLSKYFTRMVYSTRMETKYMRTALEMYANYSDIEPDVLLKQFLSKYEMQINRTMLQIDKALVMSPPAVVERQIIRFLGLGYKPKPAMFQPLSRTAYLFGRSLVTFDGTPIFLPRDLSETYFDCKFLLTRDFLWKNFTIYLHEGNFVVELRDAKVIINRKKNNEVTVVNLLQPGLPIISEFPTQFHFTTVTKLSNVLKIKSVFGLEVYCHLDVLSCNVTVPGYYHNKTMGLFGTNNVEYSDDLKMPNGQIALNIIEFINAFEITSKPKCVITAIDNIISGEEKNENHWACLAATTGRRSPSNFEAQMKQSAFKEICPVEDVCSISKSYISSSMNTLNFPVDCGCNTPPKRLVYNKVFTGKKVNLHITLLMKLVPDVSKAVPQIKKVLEYFETQYSDKLSIQYTIVGFAGNRVYKEPHIQTASGKVTYDAEDAAKALDLLQFNGPKDDEKLGISALKFAVPIDKRQGMKIFMLFENEASYTNRLPQIMDVSEMLRQHGVILNVVNNYKMQPGIIAKDSHKTRYHLNLPRGEPFNHRVTFPRTDDYIPIMKQSEGAVFTLKSFTNDGAGWAKALTISVAEVWQKQTRQDKQQCKRCSCNVCKNVAQAECDYGLARGRRSH